MQYAEFERLITIPRTGKYLLAAANNRVKAQALYRANIRLSQEMFALMCLFEVVFRNAIDRHYRVALGPDWVLDSSQPTGFLQGKGCEKSLLSVQDVIAKLGAAFSPDKAVPEFTFGFWTYLFGAKQFAAAGSSLLRIFPAKPAGYNHTQVFKVLNSIGRIRNRIAHHEPICFGTPLSISTAYTLRKYNEIMDVLQWMGIHTNALFFGIDHVHREIAYINNL